MSEQETVWCVIAGPYGYQASGVPIDRLGSADIIAVHPTRKSAEDGVNRATLMMEGALEQYREILEREHDLRGKLAQLRGRELQASLNHEVAVRNKIIATVHEIARPRAETVKAFF